MLARSSSRLPAGLREGWKGPVRGDLTEREGSGSSLPESHLVEGPPRHSVERFGWWLLLIAAAAFFLRLVIDYQGRNTWLTGDGFAYSIEAQLNAHGHWFSNSGNPDALHPPAWVTLLTVWEWLGEHSWLSERVLASAVGSLTVVFVGLAGRRIAGSWVGLLASAIAAVYPGLWVYEWPLLSETLLLLGIAVLILMAYRFWAKPSAGSAAVLGFLCGMVALTRSEQILLLFLVVTPLILTVKRQSWRRRVRWLALAYAATVIVVLPWTTYNLGRFQHPVLLSNNFGAAIAQGNCKTTYYGPYTGEYSLVCLAQPSGDQTVDDSTNLHQGLQYMEHHLGRLPVVLVAREGRGFGFWNPFQQVDLDASWEGGGVNSQGTYLPTAIWVYRLALFGFWLLLLPAVAGTVALRRRRVPVYPLLAFFAIVILTIAVTYGVSRDRAAVEIPLVLLASVGIAGIVASVRGRLPLEDEVLVGAKTSTARDASGGRDGHADIMRAPQFADRIPIRAVVAIALVISLIAAGFVLHAASAATGRPTERMIQPSNGASLAGRGISGRRGAVWCNENRVPSHRRDPERHGDR